MKKVITYGTYDLLHYGHIALLERAKALGDYLIVGVTSDSFDKGRGKLNVQQSLADRIEAVRKTGIADQIIVEEYEGQKIDDIQKYGVDVFTVGSDWVGKFDYLREYCEVTYLSRTEGISSTQLRTEKNANIRLGVIGATSRTERFVKEARYVSGLSADAVWDGDAGKRAEFARKCDLMECSSLEELFAQSDAVYVFSTVNLHYEYVMAALSAGCHVICETPLFLTKEEAEAAYALADEKGLVLFEAVKTLWYPAFKHLLLLVSSGVIGQVKDVSVACSQIPDDPDFTKNPYEGSLYDWGTIALLPILKLPAGSRRAIALAVSEIPAADAAAASGLTADEFGQMQLGNDDTVEQTAEQADQDTDQNHDRNGDQGISVNVGHDHGYQGHLGTGGQVDTCRDNDVGDTDADDAGNRSVTDDLQKVVGIEEILAECREQSDQHQQHAQ